MWELIIGAAMARVAMAAIPNVEPIMAVVILAAQVGAPAGLIAFASMLLSDLVIGPGPWTIFTSLSYGLVGLIASWIKPKTRRQSALLAAWLTLLYDILTNFFFALLMGLPVTPTMAAGIPFSILHIFANTCICFLLLPVPIDFAQVVRAPWLEKSY